MNDRDRLIPTPEELEEGSLKRGEPRSRSGEAKGEQSKRRRTLFQRRKGVGKRRIYVEPEEMGDLRKPSTDEPHKQGEAAVNSPRKDQAAGTRVESVRVRRREVKIVTPAYAPNSPQAMFYEKAAANGHNMGELETVPHTTNWSASCLICGCDGELVIQYEDNYANQTYEFFRGQAIERRCPTSS